MTPDLETRVRAVYPTEKDWEPDEANLDRAGWRAAADVLGALPSHLDVQVAGGDGRLDTVVCFQLTDSDELSFKSWNLESNARKLKYLSEFGEPFVVLWLELSLVDRYYLRHFNAWRPRGDTGYLDIDLYESPSENWLQRLKVIDQALQDGGFKLLSHEQGMEEVPFIMNLGYHKISPDDPRWEDDDFEPPQVPATVYSCLFGDSV